MAVGAAVHLHVHVHGIMFRCVTARHGRVHRAALRRAGHPAAHLAADGGKVGIAAILVLLPGKHVSAGIGGLFGRDAISERRLAHHPLHLLFHRRGRAGHAGQVDILDGEAPLPLARLQLDLVDSLLHLRLAHGVGRRDVPGLVPRLVATGPQGACQTHKHQDCPPHDRLPVALAPPQHSAPAHRFNDLRQ